MRRLFSIMFIAAAVLTAGVGAAYASSDRPQARAEEAVISSAEVTRTVKGVGFAFEPSTISVAAGDSVTITLNNEDEGADHNIEVGKLFSSAECNGPCTVSVTFVAPAPGEYQFFCIAHPDMVGTLKVN